MFNETNIMDFVNKIINDSKEGEEELKKNIEKFKEYLILTKMSNIRITEWLNKVITCLPEILTLKKKLKNINVSSLIDINEIKVSEEKEKNKRKILTKKMNEKSNEKHYHHYESTSTSSSCGGGNSTRSGC